MENASKALIIAGAILVSIILISLGIMVINSTGDVTGGMQEEMNSATINQFNAKFTQYSGTQKGSTIKALITTIQSSNASSDYDVTISCSITKGATTADGKLTSTDFSTVQSSLRPTTSFKITVTDEDKNGFVDLVTISDI